MLQLHEFREAFSQFDQDGSGSIDIHELKLIMEWLGQEASDGELQAMMQMGTPQLHTKELNNILYSHVCTGFA